MSDDKETADSLDKKLWLIQVIGHVAFVALAVGLWVWLPWQHAMALWALSVVSLFGIGAAVVRSHRWHWLEMYHEVRKAQVMMRHVLAEREKHND